jgi:hypothetical protein
MLLNSAGQVLTAAAQNGEFNNIINNPIALISPTTGAINFNLQTHTNLLPSVITATSGSAGNALITNGAGTVWGTPTVPVVFSSLSSGQLLIGTSSGGVTPLNVGTSGQVLTVVTTAAGPVWGSAGLFTQSFVSTEIPITNGSVATVAHGLGGLPSLVLLSLRCTTSATNGFSTGDEFIKVGTHSESNASGTGATAAFNVTSCFVLMGASGPGNTYDRTNGTVFTVSTSAWTYVVRAFK